MHIKRFVFNPIGVNTYVIYDDTKEAAIIDCGALHPEEKEELKSFISKNQLIPKYLLSTHLHLDHIFGNRFIYETYNLRPQYSQMEESMPGLKEQANNFQMNIREEETPAGTYLNESDLISFGKIKLNILSIPGHSPGSLCFYSEQDACIFCGDVIFRGSIGRTDLWGGDYNKLIQGIKEKILSLPDDTAIYSGHGPSTTVRYEKQCNSFLR